MRTIWGVQFKTVLKFNPYTLSLFAIGGDACFPYLIRKKSVIHAEDGVINHSLRSNSEGSVHEYHAAPGEVFSDTESDEDDDEFNSYRRVDFNQACLARAKNYGIHQ